MFLLNSKLIAQDFIRTEGGKFFCGLAPYSFLGFNAYYLQSEAARGNTGIVDDVIKTAADNKFGVIRTWAFYDGDDTDTAYGVIQTAPGLYSENGLRGLDYVVAQAKMFNIKLILTLCNNYKDYGGIPQYLHWASKYSVGNLSHNDFFVNDSLKAWYKKYMHMLLNRRNTITGIQYKNEPAIFSFELMNEAENSGKPYRILLNWYSQMAEYFKGIDRNHILSTGESGYDSMSDRYSGADLFYNGSSYLFNGNKGTSYYYNSRLNNIDYASFHLYPDGYGFSYSAGNTWIREHDGIAYSAARPALLGEFGVRSKKTETYKKWLDDIYKSSERSAIVWQYKHPLLSYGDEFSFNENDKELFSLLVSYASKLPDTIHTAMRVPDGIELFQNYPNPFNPVTKIKYSIPEDMDITMELFNILGERIGTIDNGFRQKGIYELTLSFGDRLLGSGVYVYTLRAGTKHLSNKLILLK